MKRIITILILMFTLVFISGCESKKDKELKQVIIEKCGERFASYYDNERIFHTEVKEYKSDYKYITGEKIYIVEVYGNFHYDMFLVDSEGNVLFFYNIEN